MTQSTGAERSPAGGGGLDESGTDPRYHAGFQRGYRGRDTERRTGGEERLRSSLSAGRAANEQPARQWAAPSLKDASGALGARQATPMIPSAVPEKQALPLDPTGSAGQSVPTPTQSTVPQAAEPAAPLAAEPGAVADDVPAGPVLPVGRAAGVLAVVGAVIVLLGLLSLWNSSQSWYDYSPVQSVFGPEQYLRVLTDNAIGPFLTVGLTALALAVVLPLLRAPRR